MQSNLLPDNTILISKYRILNKIGQGGFGITYRAQHIELNKIVAIKECFVQQWCTRDNFSVIAYSNYKTTFDNFKEKFLKEAQTLARCEHKLIVNVLDYFETNNTAYFVMEYIEGDSLKEILKRENKLDEQTAISIIIKLSEAVDYLHQNKILHRDIKPDNIIINANYEPVLLDFGAARELVSTQIPHTIIQTPGYAPIEQNDANSKKGFYIDIYAIGATLYHLVTGRIPVPAQQRITEDKLFDPKSLNPNISDRIHDVILKAMAVMYYNRYQSVQEFLVALTSTDTEILFDLSQIGLTDVQKSAFEDIVKFINDPDQNVFILTGMSNTGKSFLIKHLLNYFHFLKRANMLLANTSKVAESIRLLNNYEKVTSLYNLIYNFNESSPLINPTQGELSPEEEDNIDKIKYGYKRNFDDDSMIYIVDNSELVSDDPTEFEFFIFGSGKLLEDLVEYSEIKHRRNNRKIIFVGDDKQMLRGSRNLSSLSIQHIKESYGLTASSYELKELFMKSGFELIYENALSLCNCIENNIYNNLVIKCDSVTIVPVSEDNISSIYLSLSPKDTIILEHTNKKTKVVNEHIRKLLGRKDYIEIGDRVVLHNNINAIDDFNQSFHFGNGEFAEIIELYERESYIINKKGKPNQGTDLVFRNIKLKFEASNKEVDVLIIENFFNSNDRDLGDEEIRALHVLANKKFNALTNQEKFNILKTLSFSKGITDLSEFENNLSLEKKEFNNLLTSKKALKDIRKYFLRTNQHLNAAKIKFGYCITCHRSQGFKWPNVIVNCENNLSKTNDNYFRWLYTSFTRTTAKLYLVSPPTIKPTINLKLSNTLNVRIIDKVDVFLVPDNFINYHSLDAETSFKKENPQLNAFYEIALNSLNNSGITITKVEHFKYQECYYFNLTNKIYKIRFSYNGNFLFKKPTCSGPIENKIVQLIFQTREIYHFPDNYLKEFYRLLRCRLQANNIDIMSIEHNNNAEVFTLIRVEEVLICIIYYTADQFFTTVVIQKVNSKNILDDFISIIETRLL